MAIGTSNGQIHILSLKEPKLLNQFQIEGGAIWNMSFSPNGKDLVAEVSSPGPNHVVRFDAATGKARWKLDAQRANRLCFTPDGKAVCYFGNIGRSDPERWRWLDVATGKPLSQTLDAGYGHDMAVSPDGNLLAIGGYDGEITQWDLRNRSRMDKASADPAGPVSDLRFSDDGPRSGWSYGWYSGIERAQSPDAKTQYRA